MRLRQGPRAIGILAVVLASALVQGTPRLTDASENSIISPDAETNAGLWTSLALDADGNPAISHHAIYSGLKVLRCGDPSCAFGNTIADPDVGWGVGQHSSLVLDASGNPVVSYYDSLNNHLKVLHCGNPACTTGNSIVVADTLHITTAISLAIDAAGHPVVSYSDSGSGELKLLHCGNPNCTSGNVIAVTDAEWGYHSSLVIGASDNPIVSYWRDGLRILRCGDATCTLGNTTTLVDADSGAGTYTSLVLDGNGHPVVSYHDHANGDLKVIHCGNPECTSGNTIASPDTTGHVGEYTSVALDAKGNPAVSYFDVTNGDLKLLRCGNESCTQGNTVSSPDRGSGPAVYGAGFYSSLTLDENGNPIVSYQDNWLAELRVLHCKSPTCSETIYGDADCDKSASAIDAVLILQLDAGLVGSLPCQGSPDANRDGNVNSLDAALVLQYAAGLIPTLPPVLPY